MTIRFNIANERMKYEYRIHLGRAMKKDPKTVLSVIKHLYYFEKVMGFIDYRQFNKDRAEQYIRELTKTDKSLSFMDDNFRSIREFLFWLERQKGYRNKINTNHIDYLSLTSNQKREAKSSHYRRSHKVEDGLKMIQLMPERSFVEQRNKAMMSLQLLCGLRISEFRTVKITNLIEEEGHYFIHVTAKNMSVKYGKTRQANFMPFGQDLVQNVLKWRDFLINQGFSKDDPLFPKIDSQFNQLNLSEVHLSKGIIKSDTALINVFKKASESANLPYYPPHTFRHTIARFAAKQSPEFLNAVRQALGHDSINTTFKSYGELSEIEQRERIGACPGLVFDS